MSWSLALQNGDLTLAGGDFGTVTNEQKLVQDLRGWVLEHMGTDDLHLGFGSLIDGGIKPDGTIVEGVIGTTNDDVALTLVQSDLNRIVQAYQAQQLARAKNDRFTYNKSTLTAREVLLGISNFNVVRSQDALTVTLTLQTAAGRSIDFTFAIPTTG